MFRDHRCTDCIAANRPACQCYIVERAARPTKIHVTFTEEQVDYLLSLVAPIVSADERTAERENTLAWQCERLLDSELLAFEEATPELNDGYRRLKEAEL